MSAHTQSQNSSGIEPVAENVLTYPYLITWLEIRHVLPLPRGLPDWALRNLARQQAQCNRLPTWLVVGPDLAVYFDAEGYEALSGTPPITPILTAGRLAGLPAIQQAAEYPDRQQRFIRATAARLKGATGSMFNLGHRARWARRAISEGFNNTPVQGADGHMDVYDRGRPASVNELIRLSGHQIFDVPKGLARCPACLEWRGTCLGTKREETARIFQSTCRCDNHNLCASCGGPLAIRKLNSYFYDEAQKSICHFPGYWAYTHRCVDGQEDLNGATQ